MSEIQVCGWGAVSPAGWGVASFRDALTRGSPLPVVPLERPGWEKPLRVRQVPAPAQRLAFTSHPRLRRASPITLYAAAAALEAMEAAAMAGHGATGRVGIVMCVLTGCCQYSQRFFAEILQDPPTASPLIFPETVFNAPISHVATLLGHRSLTYTLVGDPATFLQGVALAAAWLVEERVEGCLVVGAEEISWLLADVLWHFDHGGILSGGAGAVYLTRRIPGSPGVNLQAVTDAHLFLESQTRIQAAQGVRRALPSGSTDELLCDSTQDRPRIDRPERTAWSDWSGARLSPKVILGEGLMAAGAWQCVAACDALAQRRYRAANVSIVGCNQQAIGARFQWTGG